MSEPDTDQAPTPPGPRPSPPVHRTPDPEPAFERRREFARQLPPWDLLPPSTIIDLRLGIAGREG